MSLSCQAHHHATARIAPLRITSCSCQSQNVHLSSETSSVCWNSKFRSVWGQKQRICMLWRCLKSHSCRQHCLYMLAGMILRSTIVKLLQHRIGLFTPDANGDIPPAKSHIPTTQQVFLSCLRLCECHCCSGNRTGSAPASPENPRGSTSASPRNRTGSAPGALYRPTGALYRPARCPRGVVKALLGTMPVLHVATGYLYLDPHFVHLTHTL